MTKIAKKMENVWLRSYVRTNTAIKYIIGNFVIYSVDLAFRFQPLIRNKKDELRQDSSPRLDYTLQFAALPSVLSRNSVVASTGSGADRCKYLFQSFGIYLSIFCY